MPSPLMPKATAVWLIENTTLTFEQIGGFCDLHTLEVQAIADGDIVAGMVGRDPIASGELTFDEIKRCSADPAARLEMSVQSSILEKPKRKGKYTPVSKRQDKPSAILWLVTEHPKMTDTDIMRLLGTTKPTIKSIRDKTHKSYQQLKPKSPVTLGLCSDKELTEVLNKYSKAS